MPEENPTLEQQLLFACENQNLAEVKRCVEEGANINSSKGSLTPLCSVIESGNIEILEYLISQEQTNTKYVPPKHLSLPPIMLAENKNNVEMTRMLYAKLDPGDIKKAVSQRLISETINPKPSSKEMLELYIELGADINQIDHRGSLILQASKRVNSDFFDILIKNGATINLSEKDEIDQNQLVIDSRKSRITEFESKLESGEIDLRCPITLNQPNADGKFEELNDNGILSTSEAVLTPDNKVYDKTALLEHLKTSKTNPTTRQELHATDLIDVSKIINKHQQKSLVTETNKPTPKTNKQEMTFAEKILAERNNTQDLTRTR